MVYQASIRLDCWARVYLCRMPPSVWRQAPFQPLTWNPTKDPAASSPELVAWIEGVGISAGSCGEMGHHPRASAPGTVCVLPFLLYAVGKIWVFMTAKYGQIRQITERRQTYGKNGPTTPFDRNNMASTSLRLLPTLLLAARCRESVLQTLER